jgi:hypothetical protein
MKRERRQPTRREWRAITGGPGRGPVVRRIVSLAKLPGEATEAERLDRIAGEYLDAHLEDEGLYRREEA